MQNKRNKACLEALSNVNGIQAASTPSGECITDKCMQGRGHVEGWTEQLGCAKCCGERHPTCSAQRH